MKNNYLQLANKNLSNNFNGEKIMSNSISDLTSAIANKFGVTITSTAPTAKLVAVLPSYFKTMGISMDGVLPDGITGATPHYHNRQALLDAGIMVDAVIDDATWALDGGGNITIYGTDPSKKIRDFLEYIKYYTRSLSKVLIHSPNIATYRGSLRLQQPNPYYDSQRMPIDLNQYFRVDQYQDDKIELDFTGIDLAVTPDLLMLIPIPANSTVSVDFFFN